MLHPRVPSIALAILVMSGLCAHTAAAEQTIVFFRHGEKPSGGLGQITCKGLNRALALPTILISRFGTPDYLYAPDPTVKINDPAGSFYYVRPLATIEPTAIRVGKSVNTHYGFNEISGLRSLLITSRKADTTIFVAWEHLYLQRLVQDIMNRYGGGVTVPAWPSADYDSLYVVRVNYVGGSVNASFRRESQGLNGQPTACP
jgi:hypothetical protein